MSDTSTTATTNVTRVTSTRRYWRRREGPIQWWPWGLIPLICLPLLFLWGAFVTAPAIEEDVATTVASTLNASGFPGASITAAGQTVDLDLPVNSNELGHARSVARATQCDTWAGELICPTHVDLKARAVETVTEPIVEPIAEPTPTGRYHDFMVAVEGESARLSGEAPSVEMKAQLLEAAGERYVRVEDDLRVTDELATDQWGRAARRAVQTVSTFERGSATWRNGQFDARGLVLAEQEAAARTQFNAAANAPTLGTLTLDVAKTVDTCNEEFSAALSNSTINFATGSADIDASSQSLLESLASIANQCPGNLVIEGHTDSVGGEQSNLALSQARADAVQAGLNRLGVTGNRLSAIGYGESQPIASNDDAAGRAQNRRIVIHIAAKNEA